MSEILSGEMRRAAQTASFVCWMLACGPAGMDESGSETELASDDDTMSGDDESCTSANPAVEVNVVEGGGGTPECSVMVVDRDDADDRVWMLSLECGTNVVEATLMLEPALEQLPLAVGQQVILIRSIGPNVELLQILESVAEAPAPLLLAVLDFRSLSESGNEEDILPGSVRFEWSIASGCTSSDSQCGVIEARRLDAYLDTTIQPEVVNLGPEQPYGEISDENERFGIWLGHNWFSECDGAPTVQVTYAVVALP